MEILVVKGKPKIRDFDKSFYTDSHDVPALWIGAQIVDLGDGYGEYGNEDKEHLRWKLDFNKEYRITIEEVKDE